LIDIKISFFLFMSLAGVIFYMAVANDTPAGAWALLGLLAAAVVVASLIEWKRNPEALLRVTTATALFLSIFAGVTWFYTRGRGSGILTAVSAPVAVGLAIWLLRWSNPEDAHARYDKAIVEYLELWRVAPSEEEHRRLAQQRFGLDEDDVVWVNQVLCSAALGTLGNYINGQDDPWWQAAWRLSRSSQRKLLQPLRESLMPLFERKRDAG
jgi:uncharacterized membrane protein